MKYISLFSGIGGLEHRMISPVVYCESDPACRNVLARVFPKAEPWDDVRTLRPPRVDVVAGGWPCQDLTPAGRMTGLRASRSRLFFRMVEIAAAAKAHTVVAENVPHLVRLRKGRDFLAVLKALREVGYSVIAWRTLDARQFGLPQHRPRVYIVASRHKEVALALHRGVSDEWWYRLPVAKADGGRRCRSGQQVASFYWTGGGRRSICYSVGYTPTLKVGAGPPKGGTSPVAVYYGRRVRKLSPVECLALQGFEAKHFPIQRLGDTFRMAGNAVPRPVGQFVMESIEARDDLAGSREPSRELTADGVFMDGTIWTIRHERGALAVNLASFVNRRDTDSLSPQAAAGLLTRLIRSGRTIPQPLFDVLYELSLTVTTRLRGTRINSFKILHDEMDPIDYRASLARFERVGNAG